MMGNRPLWYFSTHCKFLSSCEKCLQSKFWKVFETFFCIRENWKRIFITKRNEYNNIVGEYFWNVKKVNNDRSPLMDILYFGYLIVYLRFVFGCYQLDHFLFCSYSVVSKLPEAVYTWNFITNKTLLQVFSFKFYEIVQNNLVNRSSHKRWSI